VFNFMMLNKNNCKVRFLNSAVQVQTEALKCNVSSSTCFWLYHSWFNMCILSVACRMLKGHASYVDIQVRDRVEFTRRVSAASCTYTHNLPDNLRIRETMTWGTENKMTFGKIGLHPSSLECKIRQF
jgi:hypothetical protein